MAGLPGLSRRGETGRAASDHEEPATTVSSDSPGKRPFAPGARVHGTRNRRSRVVVGNACVAPDAPQDAAACSDFDRKLRVGDERPRHSDGVDRPIADQAIGALRVDDPRVGNQRRAEPEALRVPRHRVLLDRRRRDDSHRAQIGRGVPERHREVVHTLGSRGLGDLQADTRVPRNPDSEAETRRGRPHRLQNGLEEPPPVRPTRPCVYSGLGRRTARRGTGEPPRPRPRRDRPRQQVQPTLRTPRRCARSPPDAVRGAPSGTAGSVRRTARVPGPAARSRSARDRRGRAARRDVFRAASRRRPPFGSRPRSRGDIRRACARSGARWRRPPSPRARSGRRGRGHAPRGRRRSRRSEGGRGRASSDEPSRRSGWEARPARSGAG